MSENEVSGFNENLTKIIREFKEANKIAEIDLLWLFSYTLNNYSIGRYLNNQQNILNLLKKIATQLLIQKHGIGSKTMALHLWGSVKVKIIDYFNKIIKKNRALFPTLSNSLNNIVRREALDLIVELTTNKLKQIDLVSFISNLNELAVQVESFYKIPIKETEYLKNINFLENSYPNPGDFYFDKKEQYIEIDRLCIGTLNYLANHILNKDYRVNKFQVQITYKLTSSPINKIFKPTLTAKMDHTFEFWEIGDELVKLGLGYWYPYFTTKNQDKKAINVNFIIPSFVFDIINEIRDSLPKIENFQEKLESFDYTKRTSGITLDIEISHDQIKDFIAANPDKLKLGLRLIGKEYKTGEVGDIDILFQTEDGDFLVIEVKKDIPRFEPVGQIINYIDWVKKNLGEIGKTVRGIIVCKNIHPQLKSAFNGVNNPNIQVWLYEKQEEGFKFEKNLEIDGMLCPFCGNLCSPHAKLCPKCGDPF